MSVTINELVSVNLIFDSQTKKVYPRLIRWRKRLYTVEKVGLHHYVYAGRVLYHIFSVTSGNTFFRLSLNTENLQWTLEEVADGIAN